jgi:hypothetical protein
MSAPTPPPGVRLGVPGGPGILARIARSGGLNIGRLGAIAALMAAAAIGAGCGGGADEQSTATDDQGAITAVLEKLRAVQDSGDADTACNDVYVIQEAPRPGGGEGEAEGEAGEAEGVTEDGGEGEPEAGGESETEGEGGDCETAFTDAVARREQEVSDLKTDVGKIEVDGDSATAIVHTELTRADGSVLDQDVPYDLVRTPDGWRVRIADEG